MAKIEFCDRRFGVYVLGAGFAAPAGLPLATELWEEVRHRADLATGRAAVHFREDLDNYLDYRSDADGSRFSDGDVQFEEFLAFLDVEHYLGLRGSDTWSSEGNETQVLIKTLIGEILSERTPTADCVPDLYLRFARALKPPDLVLTFNYDVLLDRALEAAGVSYRLFPDRFEDVGDLSATVDSSRDEVIVLKMHGSIDWFDRSAYERLEDRRLKSGLRPGHGHPVFDHVDELGVIPLTEGPRFAGDPLQKIYRITDVRRLYESRPLFRATPVLLNPSSLKLIYSESFRSFWDGLGRAGVLNFALGIIGFSLPNQDEYVRQVVYRLVKNYQNLYWDEPALEHRKTPVVLVDFRKTPESKVALLERYRFIRQDRARFYWGGLDETALSILESGA
jgi:hypothetical protein